MVRRYNQKNKENIHKTTEKPRNTKEKHKKQSIFRILDFLEKNQKHRIKIWNKNTGGGSGPGLVWVVGFVWLYPGPQQKTHKTKTTLSFVFSNVRGLDAKNEHFRPEIRILRKFSPI